jgi:multimeric flavodoxin WrbA
VILASPIWWGIHSSLVQNAMERLGAYDDGFIKDNKTPLYSKTFGAILTASNDGFQHAAGIFKVFASNLGFTIPPESAVTWGTVLQHSPSQNPKDNKETMSNIDAFCRNQFLWAKMLKETDLGATALKFRKSKVGLLSNDKLSGDKK